MPSVAAFRIECLVSNLLSTFQRLNCDNSTEHAPGTTSQAGAERRGLPVVALYRAGVLVGLDGCEVGLCGPCALERPRVPCVSRLPRCLFTVVHSFPTLPFPKFP